MRNDYEIVQVVNSHLNLAALVKELECDEWNRFIKLLEEGRIVFSGDPSGFHCEDEDGFTIDCASRLTSLVGGFDEDQS